MEGFNYRGFALTSVREANLKSGLPNTAEVVACPVSKIELAYKIKTGEIFIFESLGECADCHQYFHVSELYNASKISPSEWPVHYLGYYCKECFLKDDDAVKLTEAEKKILQTELEDDEEEG